MVLQRLLDDPPKVFPDDSEYCSMVNADPTGTDSVQLLWIADDTACLTCQRLAQGSPYTERSIPTWPRDEGTCLEKCRCYIGMKRDFRHI